MEIKANRAFIISDTHFGARSNSVEWITEMMNWFNDDFIPKVKKEYKTGDILIHCGDVFDNRQSVNLLVLHKAINLFEELSKIFVDGIYVIAGNHDVMRKTSNEISSLDSIKYIPNVNVIKDPLLVKIQEKRVLFMPWRASDKEERECIKENSSEGLDYLFCHTNIRSLNFNKYTEVDEGLSISEFVDFKRVYAGHIHWSQKKKNITMIGNPYQMTRSDSGNKKGWFILDFKTNKEEFFENKYSPKFVKIYLSEYLDKSIKDLKEECLNNRVDLYVPSSYLMKYDITKIIEILSKITKRLDVIPFEGDVEANKTVEIQGTFNIFGLCKEYVKKMPTLDDRLKEKTVKKINSLYYSVLDKEN